MTSENFFMVVDGFVVSSLPMEWTGSWWLVGWKKAVVLGIRTLNGRVHELDSVAGRKVGKGGGQGRQPPGIKKNNEEKSGGPGGGSPLV